MSDHEPIRRGQYDRWIGGASVSAIAIRWLMGPVGQWVVNTPLMKVHQHLMMQPHHRWLDVGAGRGSLLRFIDSRVRFDHAPVGLDFSRAVLRLGRRDQRGLERTAAFAQGAATALPFPDATFDFVTCGHLVKHLNDEELATFLAEVRRVLVGGGLAIIWDFAPTGSDHLDAWNSFVLSPGVPAPQLRSTDTLMRAANDAGFELVRNARLRPFLVPPIPRASMFIGKAPEGWAANDHSHEA
jgi:SAM-dependent methyltransferase